MEGSYSLELFAREQIGNWRREADRHRLVERPAPRRTTAWPWLSRIVHLVLRTATTA